MPLPLHLINSYNHLKAENTSIEHTPYHRAVVKPTNLL
jgi:hypothetical protein